MVKIERKSQKKIETKRRSKISQVLIIYAEKSSQKIELKKVEKKIFLLIQGSVSSSKTQKNSEGGTLLIYISIITR